MGFVCNRAGGRIDELTDKELRTHLAKASREQAPNLFSNQ